MRTGRLESSAVGINPKCRSGMVMDDCRRITPGWGYGVALRQFEVIPDGDRFPLG
jgi:hypothetical protein